MGGKKKSKKTKGFTIAGEQVFAPRLSVSEDQAFKKLCALVDQETIGSLKKIFRDTLLDYVDRYLEVCTCVTPSRPSIPSIHKDGMRLSMTTQSICGPFYLDFSDPSARAKEQPEMCFLFETQAWAGKPPGEVRKTLYFRKSSDLLLGFKIPNPYDICAAYLSRPWRENPHRRSRSGMNRHMGIE